MSAIQEYTACPQAHSKAHTAIFQAFHNAQSLDTAQATTGILEASHHTIAVCAMSHTSFHHLYHRLSGFQPVILAPIGVFSLSCTDCMLLVTWSCDTHCDGAIALASACAGLSSNEVMLSPKLVTLDIIHQVTSFFCFISSLCCACSGVSGCIGILF